MTTMERRTFSEPIELRGEGNKLTAQGYAIVYNKLSENLGGFVERALPGLADKTMKEQDVRALVNHDSDQLIGRLSAGTLRMGSDANGVWYEVDIPDTTVGRDLAVQLERGDINGSSFGFRAIDDDWEETESGFAMRSLKEIMLRDVGPVTFPAYPDASSALRSLAEARNMDVADVAKRAADNDLMSLIKAQSGDVKQSEDSQAKPTIFKPRYRF